MHCREQKTNAPLQRVSLLDDFVHCNAERAYQRRREEKTVLTVITKGVRGAMGKRDGGTGGDGLMFLNDDVYTCHIHPVYAISLSCVTRVEQTGGSSGADFASRKVMAGTDGFPGRWFRNTCCSLRVLLA